MSYSSHLDIPADAIKKIILESEHGQFAKFGAIQNKKLLREVTTISRMTHKNIVRYYQAWVEGGSGDTAATTTDNAGVPEDEEDDDGAEVMDTGDALATEDGEDSDDDNGAAGWWASSPPDHDLPKEMQSSSSSSGDGNSTSWSDTEDEDPSWSASNSARAQNTLSKYKRKDSSLSNLLEHENDHAFDVSIGIVIWVYSP
jgi:translation initiation factor 2-alpha kinase 4